MEISELQNKLRASKDVDERIGLLVRLGELYLTTNITQSEAYATQLLQIAEEQTNDNVRLHYHLLLARIHYRKANLAQALDHYNKAEGWAKQTNDLLAQASITEGKAMLLNYRGQNEEALVQMFTALAQYQELGASETLVGMCYNNIACTYDTLRQIADAEKYYRLALDTLEKSVNGGPIQYINANLGLLLLNQKKYAEALASFEESMGVFTAKKQVQAQGLAYHYLAQCHIGLGNYEEAERLYQAGFKLLKNDRFYHELSVLHVGMGTLCHELGAYGNAEVHFNKALEMRLQRQYWHGACEVYNALVKLYKSMDDDYSAKEAKTNGLELAQRENLPEWQKTFTELV